MWTDVAAHPVPDIEAVNWALPENYQYLRRCYHYLPSAPNSPYPACPPRLYYQHNLTLWVIKALTFSKGQRVGGNARQEHGG